MIRINLRPLARISQWKLRVRSGVPPATIVGLLQLLQGAAAKSKFLVARG